MAFNLVPSKVNVELSINAPPVVMYGIRPDVREETAKDVVVAFVVVAFTAVKFCKVVEPVMRRFARVERPKAVKVPFALKILETVRFEVEAKPETVKFVVVAWVVVLLVAFSPMAVVSPESETEKTVVDALSVISRAVPFVAPLPQMVTLEYGVDVPMPTLPEPVTMFWLFVVLRERVPLESMVKLAAAVRLVPVVVAVPPTPIDVPK